MRVIAPKDLITNGIYKYIRHPCYLSGLMILFSLTLIASNLFMAFVIFLTAWCSYYERIEREEQLMYVKFGEEYIKYLKRTWMMIPFIL
jgi:protein-S-isoprenylcysteine O-methyltransferase Ste14